MAKHDLKTMTVADLDRLIAEASAQRAETREQRRLALKAEFEARLKAEDFSAYDVLGAKVTRAKPEKLPAKYADPDDTTRTWSGKGRVPGWLQSKIDDGAALDQFRINGWRVEVPAPGMEADRPRPEVQSRGEINAGLGSRQPGPANV